MKYYFWGSPEICDRKTPAGYAMHMSLVKLCEYEVYYPMQWPEYHLLSQFRFLDDNNSVTIPIIAQMFDERFIGTVYHRDYTIILFSEEIDAMLFKMLVN